MRTPIEPASTDRLASSLDSPHTRALARLAAERGAVLLLNKHETLPLVPSSSSSGRSTKQRRLRILVSGNAGGCGGSDGDGEKAAQGEPLCPAQSLLLGSYTSLLSARRAHVPTIAGALRTALKGEHTVTYSPGIAAAASGRKDEEEDLPRGQPPSTSPSDPMRSFWLSAIRLQLPVNGQIGRHLNCLHPTRHCYMLSAQSASL